MYVKEDIEGIRYCLLMREGNQRFYTFEGFCDSLKEAKEEAYELMRSNTYHGQPNEEYWAFDTKKWKPYFPLYCTSNDQQFDVSLPIYYTGDDGRAELFKDYINREVYGESINRQIRTRLHESATTRRGQEAEKYLAEISRYVSAIARNYTVQSENGQYFVDKIIETVDSGVDSEYITSKLGDIADELRRIFKEDLNELDYSYIDNV
jgi:hypothetical protein